MITDKILESYHLRADKYKGVWVARVQQFGLKAKSESKAKAIGKVKTLLKEHLETLGELPKPMEYREPFSLSFTKSEIKELRDEAKRLEMSLGDYVMWLKRGF